MKIIIRMGRSFILKRYPSKREEISILFKDINPYKALNKKRRINSNRIKI